MCGQTTCKQAWRAASPEIRCPSATHMHKHNPMHGNGPAGVPDKPRGFGKEKKKTLKCSWVMQSISAGCQRWPEKALTRHLKTLSQLWKTAKRTTGACRAGSPSGPHSFTHHAVGPQPPFCSPKASQPAQMCSCLCEVGLWKQLHWSFTSPVWTDEVAFSPDFTHNWS